MPNNIEIRKAAKEVVQNEVRRKLSQEALRAIQVMGAIFDGLAPLFNIIQRDINSMELFEADAVKALPKGLWEKLSNNKKTMFLAEFRLAVAIINKSQDKLGQLIQEQAAVLDSLSPGALDELLKIQETIFKAAQPKVKKPRAKRPSMKMAS
ncbi:hypothetical protein [Rufibacter soli]